MDKNDIKTTISMNDIACNDFELILIIFKARYTWNWMAIKIKMKLLASYTPFSNDGATKLHQNQYRLDGTVLDSYLSIIHFACIYTLIK